MGASWRLARVADIDIRVHASFLLVVLLGAYQWSNWGTSGAIFGAVLSLSVFACVVLHELGHSLVARAFGIPVKHITLYPIGGVAQLGRRPQTPLQEFLIALAGPAVNVVIAAAVFSLAFLLVGPGPLLDGWRRLTHEPPSLLTLVLTLISTNVFLALFNLLPALPMDGGRVFRAVLSWFLEPQVATRVAAGVARVLAVGLFALGLVAGSPMLPVIAMFVFFGAGAEVQDVETVGLLEGIRAKDAVNTQRPRLGPAHSLGEASQLMLAWPTSAFAVEHFGRLLGVVTREQLLRGAQEEGPWAYVAGVMSRSVPMVEGSASLETVRRVMHERETPYVAVVEGDLLLGLLTYEDLAHHLQIVDALRRSRGRGPQAQASLSRRGQHRT